ncbi:hypothetical protein D3C81_1835900 [compost metagenome]
MAVKTAAFGIGDALVSRQRSLLCASSQFNTAFGVQFCRMEQIQVRCIKRQQVLFRRAGVRIYRGVTGNIQRRLHGAGNGIRAEIGGRSAAFALLVIDGNAQRAIAVELNVLHFAKASADADTGRFGHGNFCRIRTGARQFQSL